MPIARSTILLTVWACCAASPVPADQSYQIIDVPQGRSADVYFEINLKGKVFLKLVSESGSNACAEFWWIKWPFGNIKSLGRRCDSTEFEIPGFTELAISAKLRVGAPQTHLKIDTASGLFKERQPLFVVGLASQPTKAEMDQRKIKIAESIPVFTNDDDANQTVIMNRRAAFAASLYDAMVDAYGTAPKQAVGSPRRFDFPMERPLVAVLISDAAWEKHKQYANDFSVTVRLIDRSSDKQVKETFELPWKKFGSNAPVQCGQGVGDMTPLRYVFVDFIGYNPIDPDFVEKLRSEARAADALADTNKQPTSQKVTDKRGK